MMPATVMRHGVRVREKACYLSYGRGEQRERELGVDVIRGDGSPD